jgi:FHS family L-fucose permease-like MFS transporter
MGAVSDQSSMAYAMMVPACSFAVVLLFAWQRRRHALEGDG